MDPVIFDVTLQVDQLVDSDHYGHIVTGTTRWGRSEPVVIEINLGWFCFWICRSDCKHNSSYSDGYEHSTTLLEQMLDN